ncbi:MAG: hypothetical protein NVSMB24_12780 [Mucilaginibacter sp.]
MEEKKIKILFVLSQLVQHGSERYLFEICQSLDKNKFQVEVMTRKYFVKDHYYYKKLIDLNIPIHRKLISKRHLRFPIKRLYNKTPYLRRLIEKIHGIIVGIEYKGFFESYDVIAVIGIETYCDALMPYLDKNKNVIIHHVNHQFQFERNYFDECPQDKIVVVDAQQELEIRNSSLSHASLYHLPLSMKLSNRPNLNSKIASAKPVRIGVVSRLFADRPNEPLLRCFHAVDRAVEARLYFYGSGNPKLYDQVIDELRIRDKVVFLGHEEDLENAIIRDKLSMLWLVSMGSSISYGSIEVASFGVPMVFWNLSTMTYEQILADTNNAMHSFSDIIQFVEFNKESLKDPKVLKSIGIKLREFVSGKFEIANYIDSLQEYYQNVAMDNSSMQL